MHISRALSQYVSRSSGIRPKWNDLYGKLEMLTAMHAMQYASYTAMQYASYTTSAYDSLSFLREIILEMLLARYIIRSINAMYVFRKQYDYSTQTEGHISL
jgi:hypothetical protein